MSCHGCMRAVYNEPRAPTDGSDPCIREKLPEGLGHLAPPFGSWNVSGTLDFHVARARHRVVDGASVPHGNNRIAAAADDQGRHADAWQPRAAVEAPQRRHDGL